VQANLATGGGAIDSKPGLEMQSISASYRRIMFYADLINCYPAKWLAKRAGMA
jgi:hypothetical protein